MRKGRGESGRAEEGFSAEEDALSPECWILREGPKM